MEPSNIKRRSDEETEIAEETWNRLTEELWLQILARLPMKAIFRLCLVCKHWNNIFKSLEFKEFTSSLTVPGTPAFLISRGQRSDGIKELWISVESSYKFHRLSIDFLPSLKSVMASDKGILCCSGTGESKYICNPVSRSWIELPACIELAWWDFYGFSFNRCTRCCFLIAGRNAREGKAMVTEIYDSHQNKWTVFKASTNECYRPLSEGTYSEGKFYWLNEVSFFGNCCCAVLDVRKREWDMIEVPKHISRDAFDFIDDRRLTCWEGLIVLVDQKAFRLWELYTEDGREAEWYPVEILSKDQEVRRLRKSERSKMFTKNEIRMNENDCVSVISPSNHVVAVWNNEGKLLHRWDGAGLFQYELDFHLFSFEVNNICWP